MFSGFILGNLPKERRNEISKDHVCGGKILFSSIISLQAFSKTLKGGCPEGMFSHKIIRD